MNPPKKLGKGLDDISHLFLSGPSQSPSDKRMIPPGRAIEQNVNLRRKVWLTISLVSDLPSAFFTANLAVELGRCGRKVLVVETAPLPALDRVFGTAQIQPSLIDLLEQSQRQIVLDGPMGMKILSFRLCPDELRGFPLEEQQILAQILRQQEEKAEQILVHANYEENSAFEKWIGLGQGVILSVDLKADWVPEAYRVCKYLFHLNPGLRIGLLGFGNQDEERWAACRNKIGEAASNFLGKTLEWYGVVPEDPLIERSITAKVPAVLLDQSAQSSVGFSNAVRNLQPETGIAPLQTSAAHSFFGWLERPADIVEGQ